VQAAVFAIVWCNQKPLQLIDTSFASFSPFYKGVEEKGKEWQIKGKTMVQWINLLWNSSFVNWTWLLFLCEKSRAIALVLPGLTAGWLAGWQAGRQNSTKFKILKLYTGWNIRVFAMFNNSWFFCIKPNLRWILDMPKFWMPFFLGQSLLLSTTVLNDICDRICENRP